MSEGKGAGNANSWYPAAISTGGNILNTFVEQMFAEHNRERNFYYNEKAADNADKRKRAWYQEFETPAAMVRQLKEAGLSPSMMYGDMGGSSGVSAPQGAGVGGGAYPSGQILDPLAIANIANINANTKKTEAEEDNLKQDTLLKQQQTTQKELLNYITEESAEFNIEQAKQLANMYRTQAELTATKNQRENIFLQYDDEKTQTEIAEMKERTNNIIQDAGLKLAQANLAKSQMELNEMQEKALAQQIIASIEKVRQNWTELDIASKSQEAQETWFEEQAKNLTNMYNAKCEELKIAQAKLDYEDSRAYERLIIDMYLGDKESFSKSFGTPYASTSGSESGLSRNAKKGLKNFKLRTPDKK